MGSGREVGGREGCCCCELFEQLGCLKFQQVGGQELGYTSLLGAKEPFKCCLFEVRRLL